MVFEDITIEGVSSISQQSEHWSRVSYTLSQSPDELWKECLKSAYEQLCREGGSSFIKSMEQYEKEFKAQMESHYPEKVWEMVEEIMGSQNREGIDPVERMIVITIPDVKGKELVFHLVHEVEDNKSVADDCVRIANRCRKDSQV